MKKYALVASIPLFALFLAMGPRGASFAGENWKPNKSVEWVVLSSPGGGSDMFTRIIVNLIKKNNLVETPIAVVNQPDGGGIAGVVRVSGVRDGGHTIMTYNRGEIQGMVSNTRLRVDDITPLAIMAFDKTLLCTTPASKFQNVKDAIEACRNGEQMVIAGSKYDDERVCWMFAEEVGITDNMTYIVCDSVADGITAALGNHVDLCVVRPAVAAEFVANGDLIPFVSFSRQRLPAPFDTAPTVSEAGEFKDVELSWWRGIAGPKDMPPESIAFWNDVFKAVSENAEWRAEYIERNQLVPEYMDAAAARGVFKEVEADNLRILNIK